MKITALKYVDINLTRFFSLTIYLAVCVAIYFEKANESICALLFVSLHTPSMVGIASTTQVAITSIKPDVIPFRVLDDCKIEVKELLTC